ncbi:ERF family protein [Ponticoccus litoralis]|uniref:ERF family protein n=1 Tax=Ponticoccus litoralis TaxID=422297 RepID=A0AAW9SNI5_9RHOB
MNAVTKHQAHEAIPADPMVSMIERLVLNPDADLDKMERMIALKRDYDRDNARIAFAAALAGARAEIPPIMKDATVDFSTSKGRTHYKHETLAGIAKVIDPILSRFGLSYRFRTDQGQGGVRVTCIIAHANGHSEETSLACAPDGSGSKNPFQAVGSAVTYLQRYTLKAALGLSAEVDDDAQGAAPRPGQNRQPEPPAFNPRAAADRLITAINRRKGNRDDLAELWETEKATRDELPDDLFAEVKAKFIAAAPKTPTAAEIDPNEIPY